MMSGPLLSGSRPVTAWCPCQFRWNAVMFPWVRHFELATLP
jgi:hypothetical protein